MEPEPEPDSKLIKTDSGLDQPEGKYFNLPQNGIKGVNIYNMNSNVPSEPEPEPHLSLIHI